MASGLKLVVVLSVIAAEARYITNKRDAGVEVPDNCSGHDFCFEHFDETLQTKVDDIIHKRNLTMTTMDIDPIYFISRQGNDGPSDSECESDIEFGDAYYVKDQADRWRIVVQSENSIRPYKQNIQMRSCKSPGLLTSSPHLEESILKNDIEAGRMYLYCDQVYTDFKYLVLTLDMENIELISSKNGVPVYCACVMSMTKRE